MAESKPLTEKQIEALKLVASGAVSQRNRGYSAWRVEGANPSVVGRLVSRGLVRWTKVVGGDAVLTDAGRAALFKIAFHY